MKKRTTYYIAILFLISLSSKGQDLHFSNYNYQPLFFNPANTGSFAGSYRAGATYRTQWSSFITQPYETTLAYVDSPITFVAKKKAWIGGGLLLFQDVAGALSVAQTSVYANGAFHYALDPKYKSVITLGVQYGRVSNSIDETNAEFGSGDPNDTDFDKLRNFSPAYSDLGIGIKFRQHTSKTSSFNVGVALQHLLQPKFNYTGSATQNTIGRRLNLHGQYIMHASPQVTWKPALYFSSTERFSSTIIQILGEYQLNKKNPTRLNYGLSYRMGDAAIITMGFIFKGWNFAFNYDLTVSSAGQYNNNNGGIELGVFKIFTVNKKPKIPVKEICPRL